MDEEDIGLSALGWAVDRIREHANKNTDRLQEAYETDRKSWIYERDRQIASKLKELEHRVRLDTNLATRLEALLDDLQFWRVQRNFEWEATREATDDRRRMLSFAAAGAVNVELTLGQIARVERAIRELDPEDINLLREMADEQYDIRRMCLFASGGVSGESFVGASCAAIHTTAATYTGDLGTIGPSSIVSPDRSVSLESSVVVTELGRMVLSVCHPYLRACGQQPVDTHG